jgi:hypothetical protein
MATGGGMARLDVWPESRPPTMTLAATSVEAVRGSVATATQRAISAIAVRVARLTIVLAGVAARLTGSSAAAGTERHGRPAAPVETV